VEAGKAYWMRPRSDIVNAKGKGTMKTYWLNVYSKTATSTSKSSTNTGDETDVDDEASHHGTRMKRGSGTAPSIQLPLNAIKQERLIDWMVDLLAEQMKKIMVQRADTESMYKPSFVRDIGMISLDEVANVIHLPRSNANDSQPAPDLRSIELDVTVLSQLRQYVAIIASTYHNNPFHNFEHACHVTMAASKFIKRIVETTSAKTRSDTKQQGSNNLYDYTQGINSDPLVVLAILFSALVHDADHRGVSNIQLGTEEPEMATFYRNKSIAEQNSLDIAWDLLMSNQFSVLQSCLFASETELQRFRQIVVNVVLATDIFDKDINTVRKERWDRAFSDQAASDPEINDLCAIL